MFKRNRIENDVVMLATESQMNSKWSMAISIGHISYMIYQMKSHIYDYIGMMKVKGVISTPNWDDESFKKSIFDEPYV